MLIYSYAENKNNRGGNRAKKIMITTKGVRAYLSGLRCSIGDKWKAVQDKLSRAVAGCGENAGDSIRVATAAIVNNDLVQNGGNISTLIGHSNGEVAIQQINNNTGEISTLRANVTSLKRKLKMKDQELIQLKLNENKLKKTIALNVIQIANNNKDIESFEENAEKARQGMTLRDKKILQQNRALCLQKQQINKQKRIIEAKNKELNFKKQAMENNQCLTRALDKLERLEAEISDEKEAVKMLENNFKTIKDKFESLRAMNVDCWLDPKLTANIKKRKIQMHFSLDTKKAKHSKLVSSIDFIKSC